MIVVFSGYNQRAVIAFLRTLEKNNLEYQIIASGVDDQIFLTKYSNRVVYTRKVKELDLDDMALALHKVHRDKINLIAPSTEALNRFLLENKGYFEEAGFVVPLVDKRLYEKISDKSKFAKICRENGIVVPEKYEFSRKFERPFVAKPKTYRGSKGEVYSPIFIKSQNDLDSFVDECNIEDFYYQEYLMGGESIYLLFYFGRAGGHELISQENYIQQPDGKSIQCAKTVHFYDDSDVVRPYVELFKKIGFRGLVMVELRRIGKIYYMIEANPRFWGPSQLFVDAGFNLFETFLADYGLMDGGSNKERKETYYYWSDGIPIQEIEDSGLVFHGNGKKIFERNMVAIEEMDLYNREDTKDIYDVERLRWLYTRASKHSNYQILPDRLAKMIGGGLPVKSRYEREREEYTKKYINLDGKNILDIGGNTGFFTIQSILDGAGMVDYYEGNKTHADFVKTAAKVLRINNRIRVYPEYYDFTVHSGRGYDIVYNLNVLHHMGDDFDSGKGKEQAKKDILNCINRMAGLTDIMVLQLGFNWKGDPSECLFDDGTKKELIKYIKDGTKNFWKIREIGVPVMKSNGEITYEDLNDKNVERNDELGEFLNRPLFIMESLK